MKVAVISQGFRAHECSTYINNSKENDGRVIIICSNKAIFDSEILPKNVEIREYKSIQKFRRNELPLFIASKQRIKKFTRGGSDIGVRIERFLNRFIWKMRYLYRASEIFFNLLINLKDMLRRKRKGKLLQQIYKPPLYEELSQELLAISKENQLDEILVFDLFDLPAVLDFVDDQAIEIKVR